MGRGERGFEIRHEILKSPGQRLPPRHKNIVVARQTTKGKHSLSRRAQAPFGAIALNGAADFAACGEAHPDEVFCWFRQGTQFQCQSGHDPADTLGCAKEIGPPLQMLDRQPFAV
jgi:hypothetical protein